VPETITTNTRSDVSEQTQKQTQGRGAQVLVEVSRQVGRKTFLESLCHLDPTIDQSIINIF
jgi:hypothetical protein